MKKLFLVLILAMSMNAMTAEKWKVTSLDWPPFSGKSLPDGGAGIAVLREALKTQDIELEVEFVPWARAIEMAKTPSYVGYYPAWPEDVIDGFVKGTVMFKSPIGFVEPLAKPLVFDKLEELKGKKIGTVKDYGNTPEFNEKVKAGIILIEEVSDDETNVKKVGAGRIDGAFIDLNNLEWFLNKNLKDLKGKVQANKKSLGDKTLHFAFNGASTIKNANEKLAAGLAKIKPDEIIKNWMEKNAK